MLIITITWALLPRSFVLKFVIFKLTCIDAAIVVGQRAWPAPVIVLEIADILVSLRPLITTFAVVVIVDKLSSVGSTVWIALYPLPTSFSVFELTSVTLALIPLILTNAMKLSIFEVPGVALSIRVSHLPYTVLFALLVTAFVHLSISSPLVGTSATSLPILHVSHINVAIFEVLSAETMGAALGIDWTTPSCRFLNLVRRLALVLILGFHIAQRIHHAEPTVFILQVGIWSLQPRCCSVGVVIHRLGRSEAIIALIRWYFH